MDQLSDRKAVEEVLEGRKEAYGVLLSRYQNLVYRHVLHLLSTREDAEDVVQEVFLIGYTHLERLKDRSAFGSWICGIVRNVCGSWERKQKHRELSFDTLVELGREPGSDVSTQPEQERRAEENERITATQRQFARLPKRYREILQLRYGDDYSCKALASYLSVSRGAVLARLFRARKQLVRLLKREGYL